MTDWLSEGNDMLDRIAVLRDSGKGIARLPIVAASDLAGRPVPDRRWLAGDWIPACATSILAGEGSAGKSILALQLAACRAVGRQWLGLITEPGRSIYVSCEDDLDELHRRLNTIRQGLGVDWVDLDGIRLLDLVGHDDTILGQPDRDGSIRGTPLLTRLVEEIRQHGATLVVIDALADVFGGDENRRTSARQFISLLRKPARDLQCTFLLIAHPSLTGIASGTGGSGSTAWVNSVRSRIVLERVKTSNGSEPNPDLRTISINKANYSALASMTIKWTAGVFELVGGASSLDRMARENAADAKFFELLSMFNAQGQDVSPNHSVSFAPIVFARHPSSEGFSKAEFDSAMQRQLANNKIRIDLFGPQSRRRSRLVVCEQ